jgi:hypothetical protein
MKALWLKAAGLLALLAVLAACGGTRENVEENGDYEAVYAAGCEDCCEADHENSHEDEEDFGIKIGFVDERFELVSLVFRLAGRQPYTAVTTPYHQRLVSRFAEFEDHPVVEFTVRHLRLGFDAVFKMAVHLEKVDGEFALIDNVGFLLECGRWRESSAKEFVRLLNDFYQDANFGEFFQSNRQFYEDHSRSFASQLFDNVNFEWFAQYGINPDNLRAVLSPGGDGSGYSATLWGDTPWDNIVYAALPFTVSYSADWSMVFIVHEFAHSFANSIAAEWYAENPEFRLLSDLSVDLVRHPWYPTGLIMAYEYVTRAYAILYMAENTNASLGRLFSVEAANGFPYIEIVYAMITDHEITETVKPLTVADLGFDVEATLGARTDWAANMEHSFNNVSWRILRQPGFEPNVAELEEHWTNMVGNALSTRTGDVAFVIWNDVPQLWIDVGSAENHGWSAQHRRYVAILIN